MKARDLIHRLEDRPFQPFRVHLSDGTTFDIKQPGMVIVSPSSAILPYEFKVDEDGFRMATRWRTVALQHIVQFSDLDESSSNGEVRGSDAA